MARDFWRSKEGRRLAALMLVGLTAGATACGDDDDATVSGAAADRGSTTVSAKRAPRIGEVEREFVGTVADDPEVYAAFVTLDVEGQAMVMGYLCDGSEVAELFFGRFDGATAAMVSLAGGSLTLEVGDDAARATGTLADGTELTVETSEVGADGEAGLYLAFADDVEEFDDRDYGGWVVLPDGSQRGALRVGGLISDGGKLDPSSGAASIGSSQLQSKSTGWVVWVFH